jgi:hypothetical protein
VLTLAEADAELQRLSVLKKNHGDEQYTAWRNLRALPETIRTLEERLRCLTTDMEQMDAHERDGVAVGGRKAADPVAALAPVLDRLPATVMQDRRVPLGSYRGLRFGMILHPQWRPEVYLEGATTRRDSLSRENQRPRAVLNAVERLARSYTTECERAHQSLELARTQLRDYQARKGQPFEHTAYMDRLAGLRDQLKVSLSGAEPQDGAPTAAELAGQIRELLAGNNVESAPGRTGQRKVSAEEPVTARIKRRTAEPGVAVETTEVLPAQQPLYVDAVVGVAHG